MIELVPKAFLETICLAIFALVILGNTVMHDAIISRTSDGKVRNNGIWHSFGDVQAPRASNWYASKRFRELFHFSKKDFKF